MDAFREELMLRLARELAASHGTLFAAALLADMGVPLPLALAALGCRPRAPNVMGAETCVAGGAEECYVPACKPDAALLDQAQQADDGAVLDTE